MKHQHALLIFLLLVIWNTSHVQAKNPDDPTATCKRCVVACEQSQHRVVIIDLSTRKIIWEWKAVNSTIPAENAKWFTSPDEAKPVYNNKYVLITGSGGVALVRIADKKVMFHAYVGGNPHSAELLPDGNIVTASSTGNMIKLFSVDTLGLQDHLPAATYTIMDAHNVVWDKKRQVLWAGSGNYLKSFTYNVNCAHPSLTASDSIKLPANLHDMFPVYGEDAVWLTAKDHVYKYSFATRKFDTLTFTSSDNIKSMSSGPKGFPVIYIRPKESWWTDEIITTEGKPVFFEQGFRMYKVRWLLKNSFSYAANEELKVCTK